MKASESRTRGLDWSAITGRVSLWLALLVLLGASLAWIRAGCILDGGDQRRSVSYSCVSQQTTTPEARARYLLGTLTFAQWICHDELGRSCAPDEQPPGWEQVFPPIDRLLEVSLQRLVRVQGGCMRAEASLQEPELRRCSVTSVTGPLRHGRATAAEEKCHVWEIWRERHRPLFPWSQRTPERMGTVVLSQGDDPFACISIPCIHSAEPYAFHACVDGDAFWSTRVLLP